MSKEIIVTAVDFGAEKRSIEAIRRAVFQEEQNIPAELDFDGLDGASEQILGYLSGVPVGTARVRFLDEKTAKIERLALLPVARGQGMGAKIMTKAVEIAQAKNCQRVVIHAQQYIQSLHEKLGFRQVGEPFSEAGIAHIKMEKLL